MTVTIEQRLREWQQELLDLTNRNRLVSFNPTTSRASTLRLVEPDASGIYEQLAAGKSLLIEGLPATSDSPIDADGDDGAIHGVGDDPGRADDSALERVGTIDATPNATPPPAREVAGEAVPDAPIPPSIVVAQRPPKPGVVRSGLPKEHTERVALRLLKQARASEQEQGINILFAAFGVLRCPMAGKAG